MKNKILKVNKQIENSELRVIDENGVQLGILKKEEALKIASEKELDLVEIQPDSNPPVCKILDYQRFVFEKKKKKKEIQKKVKKVLLKEIKLRPTISSHDYDFKLKHIISFLDKGNKVKISVIFKGREITHIELGKKIFDKIKSDLNDKIVIEKEPKLEGRQMIMYINRSKK